MERDTVRFSGKFHALADPNRLQILMLLADGEKNGQGLLEAMQVVQSTLSHHMKVLTGQGLVELRRDGKWVWYRICDAGVEELREWLSTLKAAPSPAGQGEGRAAAVQAEKTPPAKAEKAPAAKAKETPTAEEKKTPEPERKEKDTAKPQGEKKKKQKEDSAPKKKKDKKKKDKERDKKKDRKNQT